MNRRMRILLVEDNPADADLTREVLEMSGHPLEIKVAVDGADALAWLFRDHPYEDQANAPHPDFIIMDLNLPKLDGLQLLSEIKSHEELRTIPIAVLTSSAARQDVLESYRRGANCYVTKPGEPRAYQRTIKSIEHFWFTVAVRP